MQFHIGDSVKQKNDSRIGKITREWNVGEREWLVEYDHGSVTWVKETELIMVRSCKAVCSCGAKHTSFPNFHLGWCDLNP